MSNKLAAAFHGMTEEERSRLQKGLEGVAVAVAGITEGMRRIGEAARGTKPSMDEVGQSTYRDPALNVRHDKVHARRAANKAARKSRKKNRRG